MVGKTDIESTLDEISFSAAPDMGGFTMDKGPELSLAPQPFWKPIFTSSVSVGAAAKQSVSNTFVPSGSLNKNPPTLLLLLLQYIHIQFSASLNAWVQYQQGREGRGLT